MSNPAHASGLNLSQQASSMLEAPVRVPVEADAPPTTDASASRLPVASARRHLLRLITCGSVDDGKSTLIGRLLYDSKSILQDQWEAVHRSSLKRGDARVDLAMLTDGLRAEREQGITIDVAYRYFSTPRRSFILADTPGHVQYTRNMATGASTADLALLLVDARQGVIEQTRRHAYIAAMLGVSHLVLCVNKMDLARNDRAVFDRIVADFRAFVRPTSSEGIDASVFAHTDFEAIPVSALHGDNIVSKSSSMPWYLGPTLLEYVETVSTRPLHTLNALRLPVQWVARPQDDAHHDYRGICGRISAGALHVGDQVMVLPSRARTTVARLHIGDRELDGAQAPMSVSVVLKDDVDVSRGDLIVHASDDAGHGQTPPRISRDFDADIVWMGEQPLSTARTYLIKHTTKYVKAKFAAIASLLDVHTLRHAPSHSATGVNLNDIARVSMKLAAPLAFDSYAECRETGSFIIIDEATNNTVGAGMIR